MQPHSWHLKHLRWETSAYGRKTIAPLQEDEWWNFMQTHSKVSISSDLRSEIRTFLYKDAATLKDSAFTELLHFVTEWIATHKVEKDV